MTQRRHINSRIFSQRVAHPHVGGCLTLLGVLALQAGCSSSASNDGAGGTTATSSSSMPGGASSAGGNSAQPGSNQSSTQTGGSSASSGKSSQANKGGAANGTKQGSAAGGSDAKSSSGTSATSVNGGSSSVSSAKGGSSAATTGSSAGGGTATTVAKPCDASKGPAITKLGLSEVVQSDQFNLMVYAAQPPGSQDWYLVDVFGYVYVYANGALQSTPFLDVSEEVQDTTYPSLNYDERGLLGLAFAPDYETSGKFYVALVPTSTETEDHDLVLEYKRSASNPLVADPSSRKAILDLEPGGEDGAGYNPNATGVDLNKYHNLNTVLFGPDGMLYVGLGDGGGQCNSARPGVPQDKRSAYGKILRLDPNAAAPYAAAGNPFASDGDARVLHLGLRNPYRFGFDSLTGDLYIGDVGQWDFEEISYAPAGSEGLNFGWPDFEGTSDDACSTSVKLADGASHTPPIATIAHPSGSGASSLVYAIVGGTVYRGSAIPELYGAYFYGEYYANHDMRALYQCGERTSPVTLIHKQCDLNLPDEPCFVPDGDTPDLTEVGAIVQGNDGELYLAANTNALFKIVPAP